MQLDLKKLITRYGTRAAGHHRSAMKFQAAIKRVDTAKAELAAQAQRTEDAKRHLDAAKNRVEIRKINVLANKRKSKQN